MHGPSQPNGETLKRLSLVCLVAFAPVLASANIIPTGISIVGTGPYVWTYGLQLSSDQDVVSGLPPVANPVPHEDLSFGSFITIFDFAGYVDGSCTGPQGWTCLVQNVGFTPDDVTPNDDIDLPNLTWTYNNGPTISGSPDGRDLGQFGASSIYGTATLVSYAARGVKNNGAAIGTVADNVGETTGPQAMAVPEPGSLALAGLALALMVAPPLRRRVGR